MDQLIKTVKCPRLNLTEGKDLEILLNFQEDITGKYFNDPTHILGCPKYDSKNKLCKIKKVKCLYSEGWKELQKP